MTVEVWLRGATAQLAGVGVETARLDCLVLLEDAFLTAKRPVYTNRAQILAHLDAEMPAAIVELLNSQLTRRLSHEPLAYIRGKAEFYGREFIVSPAVLVPRPESEAMIELLKDLVASDPLLQAMLLQQTAQHGDQTTPGTSSRMIEPAIAPPNDANKSETAEKHLTRQLAAGLKIADIGTGSGALGVTAALELPGANVYLLEIDPAALQIAETNVQRHKLGLAVIESDLLANSPQNYDILLCNLPYVPDEYAINTAAKHEPPIALFAGPDGLDLYRRLFEQLAETSEKPALILTESLPQQHDALRLLAEHYGYTQTTKNDFIQAFSPAKMTPR